MKITYPKNPLPVKARYIVHLGWTSFDVLATHAQMLALMKALFVFRGRP